MAFRKFAQMGQTRALSLVLAATTMQSCGRFSTQDDEGENSSKNDIATENIVKPAEGKQAVQRKIGDETHTFDVVSKPATNSLIIGFPKKLLEHGFIFGGTFLSVSHTKDLSEWDAMELGDLKGSSLEPVHVRVALAEKIIEKGKEKVAGLSLMGCGEKCTETSKLLTVAHIPTVKEMETDEFAYLDFSSLGKQLKFFKKLDPTNQVPYNVLSADVTMVDFSSSTLVFDVTHSLDDGLFTPDTTAKGIKVVARWYLKLESEFQSNFVTRDSTDGVGFFLTARSDKAKVRRFSLAPRADGKRPLTYFVKNAPQRLHSSFKDAFEQWNKVFTETMGEAKIDYVFLDEKDPRAALISTGDPRYNVVEWDTTNLASYVGLGPSQSSQSSGQTFSSQVFLQGPSMDKFVQDWFNSSAGGIKKNGADTKKSVMQDLAELEAQRQSKGEWNVSLGTEDQLALNVYAQDPRYRDDGPTRKDFFAIPEGATFESYTNAYWSAIIAHEIGHTLGLRHNFRGNLYAEKDKRVASASVMEYLDRAHAADNRVGAYDRMAMAYGYQGKAPEVKDMYCSDEHVPSVRKKTLSAECSRSDATSDPFGYMEGMVLKASGMLVNIGSKEAPEWTWAELGGILNTYVQALLYYGSSAKEKSATWTQFFKDTSRPTKPEDIEQFVWIKMNDLVCRKEVLDAIEKKTGDAKEAAKKNLKDFKDYLDQVGEVFGVEGLGNCEGEGDL